MDKLSFDPQTHPLYLWIFSHFPAAPKIESPTLLEKLPSPDLPFDLYASATSADMALLLPILTINQLCLPFMSVRLNICPLKCENMEFTGVAGKGIFYTLSAGNPVFLHCRESQ